VNFPKSWGEAAAIGWALVVPDGVTVSCYRLCIQTAKPLDICYDFAAALNLIYYPLRVDDGIVG